ncbi:MAG: 2-oxoacid:acceptor oxidoreductase subunit alpha [candidate division KSB1 bacterium]|nr:2-oxoacid:acceptor oxidoreductase subunit alpha [candidate division KSB1 bacterium]
MNTNTRVLTGNEACAEGAMAAGMRFYAGYPITPSSEIAEVLSGLLPKAGGVFIQMEDEISSMAAIIGASLTGTKSMTATSGPGFSLMQENIGYAVMAEVPCVIVDVMRGGPSTGLPTNSSQGDIMQAAWGTHGDHPIIALAPSSVREAFDQTIEAFNLSERYRTPVILLMDEIIAHLNEKVRMPAPDDYAVINRVKPNGPGEDYLPYAFTDTDVPPMADFGSGYRFHVTGLTHDPTGFPSTSHDNVQALYERFDRKINGRRDEIVSAEYFYMQDAEVVVIAYGSVARSVRHVVKTGRVQGKKIGMLRLKSIWPFADKLVSDATCNARAVLVPEMNMGQIVRQVRAVVHGVPVFAFNKINGAPITPQDLEKEIGEIYDQL